MTRSMLGFIGLCVVLGAMALSAGAAQAEAGANWLILTAGGVPKTGAQLPSVIDSETEGLWYMITHIFGSEVTVLCTAGSLVGMKLEKEGSLTNGGKAKLTGCSVDINGKAASECEVRSPGQTVGTLETNSLKGLQVLVSGSPHIRMQPKEGETLMTMNMGAECPIGESIPVSGPFEYIDCENKFKEHLVKHLFEQTKGPWVLSKTAEHMITFKGSEIFFLVGEHSGLKWSGDPA